MKKKFSQVFQSIRFKKRAMQEDKAEFKPEWSKTGKEAVHRETGEKTHEYAEIGHDGKPTGKREYRNTQGKPMGESTQQFVPSPNSTPVPKKPKGEYERKVDKYLKKKYNKEEVEHLEEGRPSQRHPLEGHEYHKKSDEALVHIAKDAHAAAEAMKGHNTTAENKYRDQANDSATVRHFRKTSGMPEWYKKKYGHIKEAKDEGEYGYEGDMALNQLATLTRCADMIKDLLKPDTDMPEWVQSKITLATDYIQTAADYMYSEMKDMKEDVPFDGPYKKTTGVVTDKSGAKHGPMSQARNLARQAMKAVGDKQKKSLKPAKSFAESKKTEIVKDVIKGKKMKDKFEAEPIISSSPDTKGTIDN
jgi:hypothetical protein